MTKRSSIVFLINELKYEGLKRPSIIGEIVEEYKITKANAAYYYDRVAK
jgi:hypothetical protein